MLPGSKTATCSSFYFSYMSRAAHGDLGTSLALGQPVRTLLRDRAPLTLRLLAVGLGLAWMRP